MDTKRFNIQKINKSKQKQKVKPVRRNNSNKKIIKYLRVNCNKQKDIPCAWKGRFNGRCQYYQVNIQI